MRIRITAGAGPLAAQMDVVFDLTFASELKDSTGAPIVPAIIGSQGLYASSSSSTGFTIQLGAGIQANQFQDFSILVSGGLNANANN